MSSDLDPFQVLDPWTIWCGVRFYFGSNQSINFWEQRTKEFEARIVFLDTCTSQLWAEVRIEVKKNNKNKQRWDPRITKNTNLIEKEKAARTVGAKRRVFPEALTQSVLAGQYLFLQVKCMVRSWNTVIYSILGPTQPPPVFGVATLRQRLWLTKCKVCNLGAV